MFTFSFKTITASEAQIVLTRHKCYQAIKARPNLNLSHSRSVTRPLQSALRMLSAFQLCFAVFVATFRYAQTEVSSHYNALKVGNNTICSWNCTIIDSDFLAQRKTVFAAPNRLIKLAVKYQKKVDKKCVNQTSLGNSSGNATLEHWQVWLPANNKPSSFAHVMERLSNLIRPSYSEEGIEVKAVCYLKPAKTTAAFQKYNSGFLPRFVRGHLADHGVALESIDCDADEVDNLEPCINISKSTGNNTDSQVKQNGWTEDAFLFLSLVFVAAFIHYSPAFLCLFSPTVVTENGVRQIVLEGASPTSLRSLMANYFFSDGNTIWHKGRRLVLRLVVLPFPFLASAIVVDYLQHREKKVIPLFDLSRPFMKVYFTCYVIQALCDSFFNLTQKAEPCLVCRKVKPDLTCDDELPRRIRNHLRMQPLIFVKCWRLFLKCFLSYFRISQVILPSWNVSTAWSVFRIPVFVFFLSMIPVVTIISLVTMFLAALVGIFLTSPIVILCGAAKLSASSGPRLYRLWVIFIRFCVTPSAIIGAIAVLMSAALGYLIAIAVVLLLLLSEESLPFVALFVLVCYYIWSSYSFFTNKYHDLSLALFKCYKKSPHDQIENTVQENIPNPDNEGNVVKIPKELFNMACEELMPIREGVCILLLKVTLILSFVFLGFLFIMRLDVGATPVTKALVTFFTGSFPKVVAIYVDGGRQRKLEAMATEEKVPRIVQDYINGTPRGNQWQENNSANTEEVVLVLGNEENIEMVDM